MSHWLEEAEREEQKKHQRPSHDSAKVQDKILRIRQNYDANNSAYDHFINYFFDVCERANNLPQEKKIPWGYVEFKAKESKYENHLYYALTSEKLDKTVMTRSFPFVKRQHYKHVRSIHFSIAKKMNYVDIEIRDDYLAKTRLTTEDKEMEDIINDGLPRIKVLFEYEIKNLDKSMGLIILDWLAYKADISSLPFKEEHFKYDKRRKKQQ